MAGRTLIQVEKPTTQTVDAVKSLLYYVGRASDPLPSDVTLDNGRLVLVLSNKKDCFYTVTATKCSCPAATYHHGPCKHQRKYFSVAKVEQPTASEPLIQRGGFKPFDEMPGERARATPSMLIDCHDTTPLDVAYHSIREDKIIWPVEA